MMPYGVYRKEPRRYIICDMCKTSGPTDVFTWGSFEILPKHPYYELKICRKCAKREHGSKNKVKLDEINERRENA